MKRKKTTVMIPHALSREIETWGKKLGTGQNGFMAMASAFLLAQLSRIEPKQKRHLLLKTVDGEFQKLMDDAQETV